MNGREGQRKGSVWISFENTAELGEYMVAGLELCGFNELTKTNKKYNMNSPIKMLDNNGCGVYY